MFSWSSSPAKFNFGRPTSWRHCFFSVRRSLLEGSGYAAGDRVMIKCVVAVVKDPHIAPATQLPPSDITAHLRSLLENKEHADVKVGGEEFPAHRLVLAMRSPVFKEELYGLTREKDTSRIVVDDIQSSVFRALLHFVYTDSLLPPMDAPPPGDDTKEMIQHLLAAADRYAVQRLKSLCESILCKGIDTSSVITTLGLANRQNCIGLKDACIEFIVSLQKTDDVVASQGHTQLKRTCPVALVETWEKLNGT
ncbi:BTB/POZ and MATH domain-containing protein 2-like [Lolium perenne]|uniref:BTB/POZ and MATH domain-containing protein 2-like n=1 Tax=Lolium perenne TaxID=4522 RepID=UPI003A996B64